MQKSDVHEDIKVIIIGLLSRQLQESKGKHKQENMLNFRHGPVRLPLPSNAFHKTCKIKRMKIKPKLFASRSNKYYSVKKLFT